LNFRKNSKAILEGEMVHFVPFDGIYPVFRIHEDEIVVTFLNTNSEEKQIKTSRFEELNLSKIKFRSVLENSELSFDKDIRVPSGFSIFSSN
jgi:hypothetical protein